MAMATHRRRSYLPLFTLLSLGWVHEAHAGVSHSPGRTDDESQRSTGAQVARETATLEVKPALLRQHRLTATTEPADDDAWRASEKKPRPRKRRVEATAAKMIAAGRLAASLDQVDGVLHFHATQDALDSFDESIKALCLGVNACYEHAEQLAA